MEFGRDLTPQWRKAHVPEYVLIGELGRRPPPPDALSSQAQKQWHGGEGFVFVDASGQQRSYSLDEYRKMAGSACYSLNLDLPEADGGPDGYERVLIEEVSRELLHIKDAQDAHEGRREEESLCAAVAFRWRGVPKRSL